MNFPITILQGAFKDIRSTVDNIMDYATYKHSLGLDFGNESQRMKESSDFFNIIRQYRKGNAKGKENS